MLPWGRRHFMHVAMGRRHIMHVAMKQTPHHVCYQDRKFHNYYVLSRKNLVNRIITKLFNNSWFHMKHFRKKIVSIQNLYSYKNLINSSNWYEYASASSLPGGGAHLHLDYTSRSRLLWHVWRTRWLCSSVEGEQGPDFRKVLRLRNGAVRTKQNLSNASKFVVC